MVTLRVIVDQIVAPVAGGIGRYTEELTRELISTAPRGADVVGLVSASPQEDYDRLEMLLPGLAGLEKFKLQRRELRRAWAAGLGRIQGRGMVHATSLLAPLSKHDRVQNVSDQIVVTIHDTMAWSHPEVFSKERIAWNKTMAKRAHKYADAVVVPSFAVASQLGDLYDFGDRIRVIGGAVSSKLKLPIDPDARAERMGLPGRYILSAGTLEPRKGIEPLIRSLAHPDATDLPLLIAGPAGAGGVDIQAIAADAGLPSDRVRSLGFIADADLAVAIAKAEVFVVPSLAEGFGLAVIEAFSLGTPVVHSDAPALLEVSAEAGLAVPREPAAQYPERLAQAVSRVLADDDLAQRLRFSGPDRARAFSWRDSAQRVWQLHADL